MSSPKIYYTAERGYPCKGDYRWIGEWSDPDLGEVREFLTKFHVR